MEYFLKKLQAGGKTTVVALGDSITELTWHTRGRLNWCGYLQEALFETYGRNRCWVIVSGRCGETAQGAWERLDEDVLRFHPDLAIISYGMNDAATPVITPAEFRSALCRLIETIRERSGADVLLRTPNPMCNPPNDLILKEGQTAAVETAGTRLELFARTIVEVGREKKCAVADHYTSWKKLETLRGAMREEPNHLWLRMSDAVHPGPLGHLAFFRELAPLFKVPAHFPWETL
jgi:acyl-CoA thioesterase I